jgi:hypothetical protein
LSKYNRNTVKKQKAKEAKRQAIRRNRFAILAIALSLVLSAVGGVLLAAIPKYAKLERQDGRLVDRMTGIAYREAPLPYEPVDYDANAPYGKRDGSFLYPIKGQATETWLTEASDGYYRVYYAETAFLPPLASFGASALRVCPDSALEATTAAILRDAHEVSALMELMLHGEEADMPTSAGTSYTVKVVSSTYTWLYYCLSYAETEEGNFLRDPATGRVVEVGDRIAKYLHEITETETTVEEGTDAP